MRVNIGARPVYVPPVANVNVLTNTEVEFTVEVVPVKFSALNQLLVVMLPIAAPLVIAKFGALVAEPAVDPKLNVLATVRLDTKPPAPVNVKLVASAIDNIVPVPVVVRLMLFVPNAIARVLVLVETKVPVVRSKPPRSRVPAVSVVVAVATSEGLSPNVSVPPPKLKPIPPSCLLN